MSTEQLEPATAALTVTKRPPKKARIEELDAVPVREVEVVSKEEERHQRQIEKKAKKPATSFVSSAALTDRQIIGAEVDSEVLFGFLAAAERVVPADKHNPILSSLKLSYEAGAERMLIESASTNIWTAVAIKAIPRGAQGFEAMVPARLARNAANVMRDRFRTLSVGMNEGRVWIGQHCILGGGNPRDFPLRPLIREWEARAIVPAFYFEEICARVLTASSKDPTKPGLNGVLLDFAMARDRSISCTAVGSDGARMHILELPQMKIQPRGQATPPSLMVDEPFFRYLRSVANREWTALELSETQISGRGEDYQAVAVAVMKGSTNTKGLEKWRTVNVDHAGHWSVDRKDLERVLKEIKDAASEEKIDLRIDATWERIDIWFTNAEARKIHRPLAARRFGGPPIVDVPVNLGFLQAAVVACRGGLIRLGFAPPNKQSSSPVTIQGEDDQFKAIVMPIG